MGKPPFAGVWQRLNAQGIDALILGVPGLLVKAVIAEHAPGLEPAAPFLVFACALLYYSVLDSRLGGGRTFGKLWIGIRVVGRDGAALSPARAALRFLVLGLPSVFGTDAVLASHPDSPVLLQQFAAAGLGVAVCGSQLAGLYLFLFNRPARQALHDLLADSFVVRGTAAVALGDPATSRVHLAVALVLLSVSTGLPAVAIRMERQADGLAGFALE